MKIVTYKWKFDKSSLINLAINDPIIPDKIKQITQEYPSDWILVIRDDEQDPILWVSKQGKMDRIELNQYKEFELHYFTPGRSSGYMYLHAAGITGKGKSLFGSSPYSDESLEQATQFALLLEPLLGYEIKIVDCGADA